MSECTHNTLTRIEGPLHPSGKDYVCPACGEQFKAEPSVIGQQQGEGAAAGRKASEGPPRESD